MKQLKRLLTYFRHIEQQHGRMAAAGLIGLIIFAGIAVASGILALLGLLVWVSPYLGALAALLLMLLLSI